MTHHKKKRVAILYVCTGRYDIFWNRFYESACKCLLPDLDKHYFIFTDSEALRVKYATHQDITFVEQKRLGWPYDTLMRFQMFLRVEHELKTFDYIYFFNANIVFDRVIDESFLPDGKHEHGLVMVIHPAFYRSKPKEFSYDRQEKSLACIPLGQGRHYVFGAVNGGTSKDYLQMVRTLDQRTNKDLENNIIALWHDESHLNRYAFELDYQLKLLNHSYAFPEGIMMRKGKRLVKEYYPLGQG